MDLVKHGNENLETNYYYEVYTGKEIIKIKRDYR